MRSSKCLIVAEALQTYVPLEVAHGTYDSGLVLCYTSYSYLTVSQARWGARAMVSFWCLAKNISGSLLIYKLFNRRRNFSRHGQGRKSSMAHCTPQGLSMVPQSRRHLSSKVDHCFMRI